MLDCTLQFNFLIGSSYLKLFLSMIVLPPIEMFCFLASIGSKKIVFIIIMIILILEIKKEFL